MDTVQKQDGPVSLSMGYRRHLVPMTSCFKFPFEFQDYLTRKLGFSLFFSLLMTGLEKKKAMLFMLLNCCRQILVKIQYSEKANMDFQATALAAITSHAKSQQMKRQTKKLHNCTIFWQWWTAVLKTTSTTLRRPLWKEWIWIITGDFF